MNNSCYFIIFAPMRESDYIYNRDQDLFDCYFSKIKELGEIAFYIPKKEIIEKIVNSTAPRFYCSTEEAIRVCSRLNRGLSVNRKCKNLNMYQEITLIAQKYINEKEIKSISAGIYYALRQPASKWYISTDYAYQVINRNRKRR